MNIESNPIFKKNTNFDGALAFDKIQSNHFLPAIEDSIKMAKILIEEIEFSSDTPTFKNTILALEDASEHLDKAASAYYHLFSSEAGKEIESLSQKISPMLADFSNDIYLNEVIFDKISEIENNCNHNTKEEKRLIKVYYRRFVRNGANLETDQKEKLRKIDSKLSSLSPQFSSNVRKATNDFELWIADEKDLKGLPQIAIETASEAAAKKGKEGEWLFTLQFPSMLPIMKFLENRDLRKKMSNAFTQKCLNDEFDNSELIKKIVKLRHERAALLGYRNYAAYILEDRMAGEANEVYELLDNLYNKAYPAAANEIAELKSFAEAEDGITDFMTWDYAYYSEKLRKMLYEFNEEELRPYFSAEKVISGVFEIANRMYGLKIEKVNDIPTWHQDVTTYKVCESNGDYIGLLYVDLYPRETKKGGAWMNELRSYGVSNGELKAPHICLTCNLTKPTKDKPSLLSVSEVTTIFHEFGHCLHGMLSKVKYKTIGGTSVFWDFVELPSQIMENWVLEDEALEIFARHYETNKKIPKDLVSKLKKAKNFMMGNMYLRQLQFGYLDMAYHDNVVDVPDIEVFEDVVLGKTRLLPNVEGSTTSCSFSHIFAGGYAAGYYSYKWAEVLEADAFEKFKNEGIFNKETAASFRENVLSKGNLEHPMELFKRFRGREPMVDPLLERDGLMTPVENEK